ncbi:MAG: phosphoenolpyruvate carboxykinase domain-containing protein, partial [Caldicoprobacter sp.]|uniref:phosphoenolpyruvate carboxykinase domain-containing protein n=1 Tax=Caldicoprobacter sp. TaxID=2004500 RepID=UPI0039C23610
FCGYHICDYFQHWINIGKAADPEKLPKIFMVNWFRKDKDGNWLWPGFGENSRVLKWIIERISGEGKAVETPIGYMPTPDAIDTTGLDISSSAMQELLKVDRDEWLQEVASIREYYKSFGDKLPKELAYQLDALEKRLREYNG